MSLTRYLIILVSFLYLATTTGAAETSAIILNEDEKKWLAEHPIIRIAPDPSAAPIEWFDNDGRYRGIAADYVHLIEGLLGIRFEIVRADSWQTVLEFLRAGNIDVLPAAMSSPQRREFLTFTRPYISVSGVVISSKNYEKIEQLPDKKVAVVEGHVWDDLIKNHQVDVTTVLVEDVKTGIELTAMGAVEAMVGDIATATHVIQNQGLANLRLVNSLEQDLELAFAVRNDWPEFTRIVQKAIDSISQDEHQQILQKRLHLKLPSWWQDRELQIVFLGVLGGALVIIVTFVVWNKMLRHQVLLRTKELEEAQNGLIRAAKLESVGQLAAGVAHEVKNPLGIIQMGVDYLRGDPQMRDELIRDLLNDMAEAVQRADRVVRGLLDFSRDSRITMEPQSINHLLEKSVQLVDHELRKKKIQLKTDFAADLPLINLDSNRLQQVFVNTFMNSLHAMDSGGCLGLSTKKATLTEAELASGGRTTLQSGDKVVSIEITDTGHGIEQKDLTKVTDPFFTTKPVGEGTGLGLSICRNIVEMHNGLFMLNNLPDKGVIVRILLPQSG